MLSLHIYFVRGIHWIFLGLATSQLYRLLDELSNLPAGNANYLNIVLASFFFVLLFAIPWLICRNRAIPAGYDELSMELSAFSRPLTTWALIGFAAAVYFHDHDWGYIRLVLVGEESFTFLRWLQAILGMAIPFIIGIFYGVMYRFLKRSIHC